MVTIAVVTRYALFLDFGLCAFIPNPSRFWLYLSPQKKNNASARVRSIRVMPAQRVRIASLLIVYTLEKPSPYEHLMPAAHEVCLDIQICMDEFCINISLSLKRSRGCMALLIWNSKLTPAWRRTSKKSEQRHIGSRSRNYFQVWSPSSCSARSWSPRRNRHLTLSANQSRVGSSSFGTFSKTMLLHEDMYYMM